MELRLLHYFLAVARERNFTRAAGMLGIAQPPLSRQIRELEEYLGQPLFDRESRPIALTDAGRLLLEHAQRVMQATSQLQAAMKRHAEGSRRRFIIGFVGSTIYGPVPDLIRRFREAAPEIEVDLVEMNTVVQMEALKDGRIDAGFGRLTTEDRAVRRQLIVRERLLMALPAFHRLAAPHGQPISLNTATDEPLILYPNEPRPSYADQLLDILKDHGIRPGPMREVRELQTALGLVAAGVGIAIVPAAVQRLRRDDIVYRPIAERDAISPIIVSWRVADQSEPTRLLERLCVELARRMVASPATIAGGP